MVSIIDCHKYLYLLCLVTVGIIDEGPVSLKFICTTLLIAAVFTAVVDYYYEIPISDESLFLFLWWKKFCNDKQNQIL